MKWNLPISGIFAYIQLSLHLDTKLPTLRYFS